MRGGSMSHFVRTGKILALCSSLGLCVPPGLTRAAENAAIPRPPRVHRDDSQDVSLDAAGTLRGRVVDGSGQAVRDTQVILEAPDGAARMARTDGQGCFALAGLRPGAYLLSAEGPQGRNRKVLRVWGPGNAPPASLSQAVIALESAATEPLIRGQGITEAGRLGPPLLGDGPGFLGAGWPGTFLVGAIFTGAIIGGIAAANSGRDEPPASP